MPAKSTTVGKLIVELILKDQDFKRKTEQATKSTKKSGMLMANIAKKTAAIVKTAFLAMGAAVTAFAAITIKTGAEFEKQMALVGAIAGQTANSPGFKALEEQARLLGKTTLFTATEAGKGLEELAKAGLGVEKSIRASNDVMVFAGSTATSLAGAAALVASTMAQFSLKSEESTRIVNVFSLAVRNSLLDVESLRQGMKFAGTAGAAFGNSLEETTLGLALFRNLGLEGSLAGTNLRRALIEAAKGSDRAEKALARYGLKLKDINPETNRLSETFIKLAKANISATDAIEIFGVRAGAFVGQIGNNIAAGRDEFAKLFLAITMGIEPSQAALEAFRDTADLEEAFVKLKEVAERELETGMAKSISTTADVYETMIDTVSGQTQILISQIQELMLVIFDTFKGPLKSVVTGIQDLVEQTTRLVEENAEDFTDLFTQLGILMSELGADTVPGLANQMVRLAIAITKLSIIFLTLVSRLNAAITAYIRIVKVVNPVVRAFLGTNKELENLNFTLGKNIDGLNESRATYEAIQKEITKLNNRLSFFGDLTDEARRALEKERDELVKVAANQKALASEILLVAQARLFAENTMQLTEVNARLREDISLKERADLVKERGELSKTIEVERDIIDAIKARIAIAKESIDTEEDIAAKRKDAREALLLQRQEEKALAEEERIREGKKKSIIQRIKDNEALVLATIDGARSRTAAVGDALTEEEKLEAETAFKIAEIRAKLVAQIQESAVRGGSETARRAALAAEGAEILAASAKLQEELQKLREKDDEEFQKSIRTRIKGAIELDGKLLGIEQSRLDSTEDILSARVQIEQQLALDIQKIILALKKDLLDIEDPEERTKLRSASASEIVDLEKRAARDVRKAWKESLEDVGESAQQLVNNIGASVEGLGNVITSTLGKLQGLVSMLTGASTSIKDLIQLTGEAEGAVTAVGDETGGTVTVTGARGAAQVAIQEIVDSAIQFAQNVADNIGIIIQALAEALPDVITAAAEAIGPVIDALIENMDEIIDALVDGMVAVGEALAEKGPDLVQAIIDNLEPLIDALIEVAETLIIAFVDAAPDIIDGILDKLPRIIRRLTKASVRIIKAILKALPDILIAIVENIGPIVTALVDAVPEIAIALIEGLLIEFLPKIPEIALALVLNLVPLFLELFIVKLPAAAVKIVAKLYTAAIEGFGKFLKGIGEAVKDFFSQATLDAAKQFVGNIFDGLKDIGNDLIDFFKSILKVILGPFIKTRDKEERRADREASGGGTNLFEKLLNFVGLQSGIDFVPRTMLAKLHPGEAVIPADKNPFNPGVTSRTSQFQPVSGGPAGARARGATLSIPIMMDGHLIDGVIVRGVGRGTMPETEKMLRKASGVQLGIDTRDFKAFSS